jgi:hypothetical protein
MGRSGLNCVFAAPERGISDSLMASVTAHASVGGVLSIHLPLVELVEEVDYHTAFS